MQIHSDGMRKMNDVLSCLSLTLDIKDTRADLEENLWFQGLYFKSVLYQGISCNVDLKKLRAKKPLYTFIPPFTSFLTLKSSHRAAKKLDNIVLNDKWGKENTCPKTRVHSSIHFLQTVLMQHSQFHYDISLLSCKFWLDLHYILDMFSHLFPQPSGQNTLTRFLA